MTSASRGRRHDHIALTVAGCPLRHSFEDQVSEHVGPLVRSVTLEFDVMTPEERSALTERLRGGITGRTKGLSLDRSTRVIAIASGKGGVGKSTLAANLAAAFARLGHSAGILDADVYGHSIPHMLGIQQAGARRPDDRAAGERGPEADVDRLLPGRERAVMWRGPCSSRTRAVPLGHALGRAHTLVVDMPPGTGDVSISLGQLLPRAEVVVVTTPQPATKDVAARAAVMAQKTNMQL